MIEFEISGLNELIIILECLGRDPGDKLIPSMEAAMRYIWGQLPEYPPKPQPGEASKYWTDKQRRWFFWAVKKGLISPIYRRRMSGGLGGSISTEVISQPGELIGVIGPGMPYAPYVVGKDKQARIHQGRWWVLEDEVEKNVEGAVAIIENDIFTMLDNPD
jgi:hypothetical protein